jgi:hypothetical protein
MDCGESYEDPKKLQHRQGDVKRIVRLTRSRAVIIHANTTSSLKFCGYQKNLCRWGRLCGLRSQLFWKYFVGAAKEKSACLRCFDEDWSALFQLDGHLKFA